MEYKEKTMRLTKESFTVQCVDGVVLKGLLIIPGSPKAVVQFNGGTAAKKGFYQPFLEYLAAHGYICCLWDYRGSGDSSVGDLASCGFSFKDYGLKDMPAVKAFLREKYPTLPFLLFGHSAGGQQVGFMEGLDDIKGMVNFAVSTGYLWHMPLGYRLKSLFFFFVFSPLSILFKGYVNAKKFGIMEDLPRNVVREWRAWCLKKAYFFDREFYGQSVPKGNFNYNFPVHVFWATDDPISNKRSVHTFWGHVHSTEGIGFTQLHPQEIGEKAIGHFGFFKRKMQGKLWPKAVGVLDSFLNQKSK